MKNSKIMKKIMLIITLVIFSISTMPIVNYVEAAEVFLTLSAPSSYTVTEGSSISFNAYYSGDVAYINLTGGSIVLNGFTANKSIGGSGNVRTITLSNIRGVGSNKNITITGGTAISSTGELSNPVGSGIFTINSNVPLDNQSPTLVITGPNPNTIYPGQTVTYTAIYNDNVGVSNINLTGGSIVLNGFTANKSIGGSGNTRIITLTNIQGSIGGGKSISITGGTAIDAAGNLSNPASSSVFQIISVPVVEPEPQPQPQPQPKPQPKPNNRPSDWIPNPNTGK
jgi:hypothetical protein